MKTKILLAVSLFISSIVAHAQVSENFDKTSLSSGSLNCWESEYDSRFFTTSRVAAIYAQPLSSESRLSLNTTNPITGSASLKVTESINVPVYQGAESKNTLTSPALGHDGDVVTLKVRPNSATLPTFNQALYVIITCGAFNDYRLITTADIGSVITLNSTISGSAGGGAIQITFRYTNYTYFSSPTTLSYSIDIDDFSTNAAVDPSNTCMTSLPVTLASFSASKTENVVRLNWSSSQESNSEKFEIHRSADARSWSTIGTQTANGESDGLSNYQFTDFLPSSGHNYYRLKMIDKDGTFAFSSIRSVETNGTDTQTVLYPNPVADKLYLQDKQGNLLNGQFEQISIVDIQGKQVFNSSAKNTSAESGIDVKALPTGIYVLQVKLANGTSSTHKLMVKK